MERSVVSSRATSASYGPSEFGVKDPAGHIVIFAQLGRGETS